MSLRKRINLNCKSCIYDPKAPGTWRQQVSLCDIKSCPFWDIRPVSRYPIPASILRCYEANLNTFQAIKSNLDEGSV